MSVGVVVGASGGIGAACARAMASSVDRLVIVGRDRARLRRLRADLATSSVEVAADVATTDGREAIARAIEGAAGPLAWLVVASGAPLRGPFAELEEEAILDAFLTNLVGPTLLLRRLAAAAWTPAASIVVIGSISASRALPNRSVYAATKAGLEHLCTSLAVEWAVRGIRVNVVAPGVIATPFLGSDRAALDAWAERKVPQRRLGRPEEVAELVRYVVLEAPDYLTGARLVIDGGAEATA